MSNSIARKMESGAAIAIVFLLGAHLVWALAGGSLSGTLTDPSGGIIPGANVALVNSALKTEFKARSDARGYYSFPSLPVGRYDLTVEVRGFKPQKRTDVAIDADAAVKLDLVLSLGEMTEAVTVSATSAAVEPRSIR